ncbi:MAG: peptidyl-prolyl cis-trans isomerase [Gammaproteobacteria bacterium]|nr:peptidyl-prolyl cis-trans isomerase [Gammaproteobacteria bacterium]
MAGWIRLRQEPVVHFLLVAALLYLLAAWFGADSERDDTAKIVVDRNALLNFMQYRATAFEPAAFGKILDEMSDAELARLIDDYIAEEVLYREGQTLNLASSDYVIRQRVVQKVRFLLEDPGADDAAADDAELQSWFASHSADYQSVPAVTFTHVFFDTRTDGPEGARERAVQARDELNRAQAGFNDAGGQGDGFPFLRNYVERTLDYVGSHFGPDFVAELSAASPDASSWQGPYASAYGYHVVLLTTRLPGGVPDLAEVREQVEQDFRREQTERALADTVNRLRNHYEVTIKDVRAKP